MGRFSEILKSTAEQTNAELAADIAAVTTLKENQVNNLFPTKPDKENLLKLLTIVNSATSENQKIAQLKDNVEDVAGSVLKLVRLFV